MIYVWQTEEPNLCMIYVWQTWQEPNVTDLCMIYVWQTEEPNVTDLCMIYVWQTEESLHDICMADRGAQCY